MFVGIDLNLHDLCNDIIEKHNIIETGRLTDDINFLSK